MPSLLIAADHAGVALKAALIKYALEQGYSIEDLGTTTNDPVDYPDYAQKLARLMQEQHDKVGILVCGTGIGVAMAANRFPWIRAAVGNHSLEAVRLARSHNNANVLCLGARLVDAAFACAALDTFIATPFEGGRHQRRLDKFSD
jgi:ribose 5-phosphate isomerase B